MFWTPKGLKMERIERDDGFWSNNMEEKLKDFYFSCLLPELIDPRYTRTMAIREPKNILHAIEEYKKKKRKFEEV